MEPLEIFVTAVIVGVLVLGVWILWTIVAIEKAMEKDDD